MSETNMTLEDKKKEIAKLFLASENWNKVYSRYENRIYIRYEIQASNVSISYDFCAEVTKPLSLLPTPMIRIYLDDWQEESLLSFAITEEQYKQVKIFAKNKQQKDKEIKTQAEKDKEEKLINILYECLNNERTLKK